jgi:hypothetical protein
MVWLVVWVLRIWGMQQRGGRGGGGGEEGETQLFGWRGVVVGADVVDVWRVSRA